MSELTRPTFEEMFKTLTGNEPFPWQTNLYRRFQDKIPNKLDIPTGLGKTSVIPIWLITLCKMIDEYRTELNGFPRRLVYVVDRRTLVDQASAITIEMLEKIEQNQTTETEYMRSMLQEIAPTSGDIITISTLRGQKIDNGEWKKDPARASIIVGTVDMIGSKLLFSGYGDGPYYRPYHAGVLGQDTLLVHDEAHLNHAFSDTLSNIQSIQRKANSEVGRNLKVIEMSATLKGTESNTFKISEADKENEIINQRLNASKFLELNKIDKSTTMITNIVDRAYGENESKKKVLIYLNKPKDVKTVADRLSRKIKDKNNRIEVLTGTLRNWDRDHRLVKSHVMQSFVNGTNINETIYLICTSAGEVGIDMDAEMIIMESAPMESIIQRLGRLNRRGYYSESSSVLFHPENSPKSDFNIARNMTFEYLETLQDENNTIDVSLNQMRTIIDNCDEGAYIKSSPTREVTDFDINRLAYSSSLSYVPDRKYVSEYLHGEENKRPRTRVAWRSEVKYLDKIGLPGMAKDSPECKKYKEQKLKEWYQEVFPITTLETLEEYTEDVIEHLNKILKPKSTTDNDQYEIVQSFFVYKHTNNANVQHYHIKDWMNTEPKDRKSLLANSTIILPIEIVGITEQGIMDGNHTKRDQKKTSKEETYQYPIDVSNFQSGTVQKERRWANEENPLSEKEYWVQNGIFQYTEFDQKPSDNDGELYTKTIELYEKQIDNFITDIIEETFKNGVKQGLQEHACLAHQMSIDISNRLGLPKQLVETISTAALYHDTGKNRQIWQRYALNTNDEPVARSIKHGDAKLLYGYRHELGSLLDYNKSSENTQRNDLTSHLIATHHKNGRPHFTDKQHDRTYTMKDNQKTIAMHMQTLNRLNNRYGAWGLAWLESIMRCADHAAIPSGE